MRKYLNPQELWLASQLLLRCNRLGLAVLIVGRGNDAVPVSGRRSEADLLYAEHFCSSNGKEEIIFEGIGDIARSFFKNQLAMSPMPPFV
jgi:hypothetical protein